MSHFDILMTITLKVNMIIRQMTSMTCKLIQNTHFHVNDDTFKSDNIDIFSLCKIC